MISYEIFILSLRYSISPRLQLATGLSKVWLNYQRDENIFDPLFLLVEPRNQWKEQNFGRCKNRCEL